MRCLIHVVVVGADALCTCEKILGHFRCVPGMGDEFVLAMSVGFFTDAPMLGLCHSSASCNL